MPSSRLGAKHLSNSNIQQATSKSRENAFLRQASTNEKLLLVDYWRNHYAGSRFCPRRSTPIRQTIRLSDSALWHPSRCRRTHIRGTSGVEIGGFGQED